MPVLLQTPISIKVPRAICAEGAYVTLSDGRKILDGDGSAAVACIGHCHRRVIKAMTQQASSLDFVWSGAFASPAAEELADYIVGDKPGGLTHAFFVSSGSEAIEAAIKICRQYFVERGEPNRDHIIARNQSFHGMTLGALSVSGHKARRAPFLPFLSNHFSHVSPCFPFHHKRDEETDEEYIGRLRDELDQEFLRIGPGRVAAFLAETVVGGTLGCVAASPGYFRAMRDICDKHGALLILDEIMCGMGRTGLQHAWMSEGIFPDIQTIGKALGGGYQPISATLVSGKIIDVIALGSGRFVHGHTYQAHPVACAAALEVQRIIREQNLILNSANLGVALKNAFTERLEGKPWLGDIRGRGLFVGIEFLANREHRLPFDPTFRISERVRNAALDHGLSVFAGTGTIDGLKGDHVFIAPPFNIGVTETEMIADRFMHAADEVMSVKR